LPVGPVHARRVHVDQNLPGPRDRIGNVAVLPHHVPAALHEKRCFHLLSCPLLSLIPHPSSLIPHPSSLIPHPSSLIPHPSSLILHPSSLILHPSSLIPHPSSLVLH